MIKDKIEKKEGNVKYSIWPIPIDFEPKSAEWWEKTMERMSRIMILSGFTCEELQLRIKKLF